MASDDAWWSDAAWTAKDQALFWRKLARARRTQAWAADGKAGHLWATGDPALRAEARALLATAAARHGLSGEEQLARFALDEGDLAPAEALYRRRIAERPERAGGPRRSLAKVLARSDDPAKRAESRALFEGWFTRDWDELFGPWEEVRGRVLDLDDFSTLAEALAVHHEELRAALAGERLAGVEALDRAARLQSYPAVTAGILTPQQAASRGPREVLVERYLASLGAYLGKVLEHDLGGRWVRRRPATRSTVKVGRRELDPFRHAYEVLFFDRLPGELLAGLPGADDARRRGAAREPRRRVRNP